MTIVAIVSLSCQIQGRPLSSELSNSGAKLNRAVNVVTLVIGPIYEVYVVGQVRGEIINSSRPAVSWWIYIIFLSASYH